MEEVLIVLVPESFILGKMVVFIKNIKNWLKLLATLLIALTENKCHDGPVTRLEKQRNWSLRGAHGSLWKFVSHDKNNYTIWCVASLPNDAVNVGYFFDLADMEGGFFSAKPVLQSVSRNEYSFGVEYHKMRLDQHRVLFLGNF